MWILIAGMFTMLHVWPAFFGYMWAVAFIVMGIYFIGDSEDKLFKQWQRSE